jgi:hypothetical protein
MSKRFLITENERNSILSLYAKKGIILEQDRTTGTVSSDGAKMYGLSPYYMLVEGNNMTITDSQFNEKKYTADGDLNNLKFNLFTAKFESPNMWAIDGERSSIPSGTTSGDIIKSILDMDNNFILENELGYAVALHVNGAPTLFGFTVKLIPMAAGNNPGQGVLSESEVIGVNEVYTPKNRKDFENLSYMLQKYSYRTYESSVTGPKLVTSIDYTKLDFKDFEGKYAVGISIRKGPEGQGIFNKPQVVSIEIKAEISDPFKFDKRELTDQGSSDFNIFVQEIKSLKDKYSEEIYSEYINFLKNNTIKVTTSASIDNDPEGKTANSNNPLTKTLESCRKPGGRPRKEYNQCLSEARAKYIIMQLNVNFPELRGVFVANAIGETDQFDPGKKWPQVKDSDLTAKNRRLEIILPAFTKKVVVN